MARPLRIEYEGAFYHVLSRGNERKEIFWDDKDRSLFTEILGEMSLRFSVDVFAYVLMDNHYHLLLRTNRPNISKSIQWLGVAYTRRFNVKHHRNGHLFQGRFKSFLVENEKYLTCPFLLYPKEMVQDYSREEKRVWEDFRHGLFFGSQEYCKKVKSKYMGDKEPDVEVPQKRFFLREEDLNTVLGRAAAAMECDISALINPRRINGQEKDKRDILIYLLWNTGLYRNNEIAKIFNLSYSSVSKQVSNIKLKLGKESHIKKIFSKANSLFKM
ncbi:transposase [Candidatus Kuenenia sp.]|uniref:transposase n=1 Tax=Candidatus Kuenenia sp. TaxID=2499824 RepID=UPI00322048E2